MPARRRPPGFVPGYMTEDLQLREIGGPPRYTSRTDKAIEHITLADERGAIIGYIYANDEDDAAGWQLHHAAGFAATNLAVPWVRMMLDAKQRGLRPTQALDEMMNASGVFNRTRVVPGSRQTSANLAALKSLAGEPPAQLSDH